MSFDSAAMPTTAWQRPQRLVWLAALVYLSCWAGIELTRGEGRIAAIWLSNGLVLGVVMVSAVSAWPRILMAAFAGNLAANLAVSDSVAVGVTLAFCNMLEVLIAAWPLYRRFGTAPDLTSGSGLLHFSIFGLLLAPAASGSIAALSLSQYGAGAWLDLFSIWFLADCTGLLTVTPLMLALLANRSEGVRHILDLRSTLLPWGLLAAVCLLVFAQTHFPLLFLPLPPLLLLVYRKGLPGAVLGLATVTVASVLSTNMGHGPLWLIQNVSPHTRVLILQLYLATVAGTALVVGMLLAQRERLGAALKRSEAQLRAVTDNLPALVAHIDADERYRFVNAHIGKVFGGNPAAMIGRTMREVRGETIYADIAPHVREVLAGRLVSFESHALVNGRSFHYQSNYIPDIADSGRVQGFYAMTFDITARKNAELRQAASEERLATITDNLPGLIAYLDAAGIYRFCNATHVDWFGGSAADWLGLDHRSVLDGALAEVQQAPLSRALRGERVEAELQLPCRREPRIVNATFEPHLDAGGAVVGVYVFMHDVTGLKAVQNELQQMASHDMLTGLANRREFHRRLEATIERSRREGGNHALMFLDIDHFKSINDQYGHAGGDAVLREVALRLSASVRHLDTVARLAGDEFVLILDGLHNAEEPQFIARKIVAAMQKPVMLPEGERKVGVSIGIAYDAQGSLAADALLSLADVALYEAKAAGRNTWRLADSRNPPSTAAPVQNSVKA